MAHTTGRYTSSPESSSSPTSAASPTCPAATAGLRHRTRPHRRRELHGRLLGHHPAEPARHLVVALAGAVRLPGRAEPARRRGPLQRRHGSRPARSRRHRATSDRAPPPVPEGVPRLRIGITGNPSRSTRSPTWRSSTGRERRRSARTRRSRLLAGDVSAGSPPTAQAADHTARAAGRLGATRLPRRSSNDAGR